MTVDPISDQTNDDQPVVRVQRADGTVEEYPAAISKEDGVARVVHEPIELRHGDHVEWPVVDVNVSTDHPLPWYERHDPPDGQEG